ncbi:cytochrome C551 [Bacillus sp. UMB0899]|nr:cytochrome C551 [Bacillus sp. UMB0899]
MKKTLITSGINIILAGCLVFLLFIYKGPSTSESAHADGVTTSASNPEEIVNSNCITCHGENLQGGGGPALDKIGSKLAQNEIEDIINNGKNNMPSGLISSDDAKVVAEWLAQKK